MTAPDRRACTIRIAPGWCDQRPHGRFHWRG
jgi:hypothetical protein